MRGILCFLLPTLALALGCNSSPSNPTPAQPKSFGHEQGNGIDNTPFGYGYAWFVGDVEVNYCMEVAPDFGLSVSETQKALQLAFSKWRDYIQQREINDDLARSAQEQFPSLDGKDFQMFTRSNLRPSCDGSEDIKFYFGLEDAQVTQAKSKHIAPTAFAFNTLRGPIPGKSRGFVWVTKQNSLIDTHFNRSTYPHWNLPNRLLGVLLHELGHIYGIGHINGTIMAESFGRCLIEGDISTGPDGFNAHCRRAMVEIDFENRLYTPPFEKDSQTYDGLPTKTAMRRCRHSTWCHPDDYVAAPQEIKDNYKELTGLDPNGPVTSRYKAGKFQISDTLSVHEFDVTMDYETGLSVAHSEATFKFFFKRRTSSDYVGQLFGQVFSQDFVTGSMKKSDGTELEILAERNINGPFALWFVKQGKKRALLVMDRSKL